MAARLALEAAAWLATYAIHSTVILGAALLAAAALDRAARRSPRRAQALPAVRERLWKAALLGGIASASLQAGLGIDPLGLRPALSERAAALARPDARAPARAALEPTALPALPLVLIPAVVIAQHAAEASEPRTDAAGTVAAPSAPGPRAGARADTDPGAPRWLAALLALWALGAALGGLRWVRGWFALRRALRGRAPVSDARVRALFAQLAARARLPRVEMCVARGIATPITRGVLRPEVCLPPRALAELSGEELAALLAHELAHAARRDPAWIAACRALEALLFVQPLNHVVARRLEDDVELLCDDRAVAWIGARLPLASCLTEVAGWLVGAPREPRLALGMAAHGARLTRRVERLVDDAHEPDPERARALPTAGALAVLAAVALLVPGVAAQRRHEPPAARPEPQATDRSGAPAPASPRPAPTTAPAPLALDQVARTLAVLRADLDQREGGEALRPRLDVLAERLKALQVRAAELQAALDAPPPEPAAAVPTTTRPTSQPEAR